MDAFGGCRDKHNNSEGGWDVYGDICVRHGTCGIRSTERNKITVDQFLLTNYCPREPIKVTKKGCYFSQIRQKQMI